MSKKLSVVIVGAAEEEEKNIRAQIGDLLDVVSAEPDPDKGFDLIRREKPGIAVLFLDHHPSGIFALSSRVTQQNGCLTVIVSRDRNPDTILNAMRSGAKDFAYLENETFDVRRVLLDMSFAPQAESVEQVRTGRVIAVFSCKGGSGATTIATNLAGALLPEEKIKGGHTVLIDLNLQMGDVLTFLDVASRYTWRDLATNIPRLDEDLLYQSLTIHRCGIHVVAQSDVLEDADEVKPKDIAAAINFLRKHFDFVVMDGLRDFSELSLLALDLADRILLTMTQDIPSLKNANRCLGIFRELGYGREKLKLVLNRYLKKGELDIDAISDALGMPVDATVANDFPTVIKAMNEGSLLTAVAPRAPVTKDIRSLVQLVRGEPPERKGWFFGRRGRSAS